MNPSEFDADVASLLHALANEIGGGAGWKDRLIAATKAISLLMEYAREYNQIEAVMEMAVIISRDICDHGGLSKAGFPEIVIVDMQPMPHVAADEMVH